MERDERSMRELGISRISMASGSRTGTLLGV